MSFRLVHSSGFHGKYHLTREYYTRVRECDEIRHVFNRDIKERNIKKRHKRLRGISEATAMRIVQFWTKARVLTSVLIQEYIKLSV